jgi:uncharacterized protein
MRFQVSEIRSLHTISRTESIEPRFLIEETPDYVHLNHPLNMSIEAKLTHDGIIVSDKIDTIITLECGRCLESSTRPYSVDFQQYFPLDLKEIDVANDVRESVLIDLPFKALCSEDCKGLCSVCGKNRNKTSCSCPQKENSRWTALKQYPFK